MSVNVLKNGQIIKLAGAVESDVIDQAIELATKQAVATAAAYAETIVTQAGGFHTKVVQRLPLGSLDPDDEEAIMPNTLYLVPNIIALAQGETIYDTYMNINDKWVQITNPIITQNDIDPEFDAYLSKIYSAIGEDDDGEIYNVHQRIYYEAVDALYKENDDGTIVTIRDVLDKADSLEPITAKEIDDEFKK